MQRSCDMFHVAVVVHPQVKRPSEGAVGVVSSEMLASAQAMRDMQPHPPAVPLPATPSQVGALPSIPQASPGVQRLSHLPSSHASSRPASSPDMAQRPETQDVDAMTRAEAALSHAAAPAILPTESNVNVQHTSAPGLPGNSSCSHAGAAATPQPYDSASLHVHSNHSRQPQTPAGAGSMHAVLQGHGPGMISQLDLEHLFKAAEQQAVARLAASHAHEQELQRCQQDAIERSGAAINFPVASDSDGNPMATPDTVRQAATEHNMVV